MNFLFSIIHSKISQRLSAVLKIYYIKSNLFNFHAFYGLIDVTEQADENLIIGQCLKFLESSSICLLTAYDITRKITRNGVSPPPKTGVWGGGLRSRFSSIFVQWPLKKNLRYLNVILTWTKQFVVVEYSIPTRYFYIEKKFFRFLHKPRSLYITLWNA